VNTPPTATVVATERLVERALGYALIARCLAYPDDSAVAGMQAVAASAGGIPHGTALDELVSAARGASREVLEPTYIELFTLSSSPDCPTFETAFVSVEAAQQTASMADIAGFYRAFGVDTGDTGFRPDDISVELEFMGFLCRKQAYAIERLGAPRVGQVLRVQRLFMREHLGRWAGALGRRIVSRAGVAPFYATLGAALEAWIGAECELLAVGPIDTVDEPLLDWPEPDDASCGADGAGAVISFDDIPVI
jgi:TorA maturation chaperone TorD